MNIPWYVHRYTESMEDNVRKIVKNGRESYYINLPKDIVRELKWRERQKLTVTRRGKRVIIEDWEG